ncbi:type IV pilin N-terminal domain-containing protein [uncultured Methanomethylovorans sp.]|uniref:type IV pilin N-terminal domain-containing protein n=1 Tax=uncultured Methanomethylovorans sp. TaxID=183759 RepID=UPI002AA69D0D|nr:type IV pilin N-terminal domain-containing protein [uncultured Methanomethylovorans sp.]
MQIFRTNESAVSPVIGVMLMLVVTVILAAAVSGFSGGLVGDTSKASQMAIKADFSQSKGMTITHMGGDTINTLDTAIIVSPTSDFGSYDQMKWEVNGSAVYINKDGTARKWYDPATSSSSLAKTFLPGENAYIAAADLEEVQPETYYRGSTTASEVDALNPFYGFLYAGTETLYPVTPIGQRFVLSLVDSDGKTIAKTEVVIQP